MQRRASSTWSADKGIGRAGDQAAAAASRSRRTAASRVSLAAPQREPIRGPPGTSSAAMKVHEPSPGVMRTVLRPTKPSSLCSPKSRSSRGAESTHALPCASRPAALAEIRVQFEEARLEDVVIVARPGVAERSARTQGYATRSAVRFARNWRARESLSARRARGGAAQGEAHARSAIYAHLPVIPGVEPGPVGRAPYRRARPATSPLRQSQVQAPFPGSRKSMSSLRL